MFWNNLLLVVYFLILVIVLQKRVTEQISLNPLTNKTGDVWHVFLTGDFENMVYGYKFDGEFSPEEGHYFNSSKILIDPYAKVSVLWLLERNIIAFHIIPMS